MHLLFILFLSLVSPLAWAAGVVVSDIDGVFPSERGRVELALDGPVKYHHFTLANPDRVVVDLTGVELKTKLPKGGFDGSPVKRVRGAFREGGTQLRLVFDLHGPVRSEASLEGNRLVVTMAPKVPAAVKKAAPPPAAVRSVEQLVAAKGLRDVVIAIDAGHGGKDVGAQGPGGVYEKDVVLAVARKLKERIDREPGMKAVLIRDDDSFLRLRSRMRKARAHQADLFLSLHANAFSDPKVHGSSVYVLSNRGASSEAARWLAEKENEADLIGGVSIDDQEGDLGAVLLDLAQNATLEESMVAAGEVLGQLKRQGKVHKRGVERAAFLVLKSPDVPSMLVELDFISNPDKERQLASSRHQEKLAGSLLNGIRGYFAKHAPPGTRLAERDRGKRGVSRDG